MPKKIDIKRLRRSFLGELRDARDRIEKARANPGIDYMLMRWICRMTAVEIHETWENYAEKRLIAALNHGPAHFLQDQKIVGVSHISYGLASYIVRGGNRYFGVRSTGDLKGVGNRLLGPANNVFAGLTTNQRQHLDALAAIRSYIVHGSEAAFEDYKVKLRTVYNISSAPKPDEFLSADDRRKSSPAPNLPRIYALIIIVRRSILSV